MNRSETTLQLSLENEVISNFVLVQNAVWPQTIVSEIDADKAEAVSQNAAMMTVSFGFCAAAVWIARLSIFFMVEELRYESAQKLLIYWVTPWSSCSDENLKWYKLAHGTGRGIATILRRRS